MVPSLLTWRNASYLPKFFGINNSHFKRNIKSQLVSSISQTPISFKAIATFKNELAQISLVYEQSVRAMFVSCIVDSSVSSLRSHLFALLWKGVLNTHPKAGWDTWLSFENVWQKSILELNDLISFQPISVAIRGIEILIVSDLRS